MPIAADLALPNDSRLLDYRIVRLLSSGGFGIVYLAEDENGEPVAIKEYLPSSLDLKREGPVVQAATGDKLNTFRYGMKCFFEEGRALAKIVHPNVVRVTNFFRANETVYMVMRYERGKTLQEYIRVQNRRLKESLIRRVFAQLLNGLREVHTHKLLHLDIKPSNIYLRLDGTPVLLDFGAARQTLSHEKSPLSPMYTPGYASPEQYVNRERLGPWSDIYSVGASMYACLAGFPPQAADRRLNDDKVVSVQQTWAGRFSPQLLELVDWCLKLDPLARPQSVFTLQKALLDMPDVTDPANTPLKSIRHTLDQ